MFKACLILLLISSLTFFNSVSPFLGSLLLIVVSLLVSGLSWLCSSKWLSLSIFFIFVGGMMVIFLYVSSVSMNSKIFVNISSVQMISIFISSLFITSLFSVSHFFSPMFFFSENNFFLISFLVVYLLTALFISSKLAESIKGALTQKF